MTTTLHIIPAVFPEEIVRYLFGFICHQDKNILFNLWGNQFPLCPRCLGLHTGFTLSLLLAGVLPKSRMSNNPGSPGFLITLMLIVPAAGVHWMLGRFSIIEMDFTTRLLTGFASGAAFALLLRWLKNEYTGQQPVQIPGRQAAFRCAAVIITLSLLQTFLSTYQVSLLFTLAIIIVNLVYLTNYLWNIIQQTIRDEHSRISREA